MPLASTAVQRYGNSSRVIVEIWAASMMVDVVVATTLEKTESLKDQPLFVGKSSVIKLSLFLPTNTFTVNCKYSRIKILI